jgi:hypothetical protein
MLKKYLLPLLTLLPILSANIARAFCPICTLAVVGGVGLSRWLKIDDTVTGLWIGGVLVSSSGWTINWLKSKKWTFWGMNYLVPIVYYAVTIIPLYHYEIIGHPLNQFWKMDKLILGTIFGSIFFWAAALRYAEIKKANKGHAQFPFQNIVWPVGILVILSVIFYFLTRR